LIDDILTADKFFKEKRYLKAMELCERVLKNEPNNIEAAYLSGQISVATKNWVTAQYFFEYALTIDKTFAKSRLALAECFLEQNEKTRALLEYEILLAQIPTAYLSRLKIGDILISLFRIEEAIHHYQLALEIKPADATCMIKLSNAYKTKGDFDQAQILLDNVLNLQPNHPIANWNQSLLQLIQGDFKKGFLNYEGRWELDAYFLPEMKNPQWDGSHPSGKKILVLAEQGWGDQIQFCRYIDLLTNLGAQVIFACPPRSTILFSSLKSTAQLIERNKPLPEYDYYIPLISLPLIFKTELHSIPNNIPYLFADTQRSLFWHNKLGDDGRLKVGISWKEDIGSEPDSEYRNVPYSAFNSVASVPDIRFIALPLTFPENYVENQNSIEWYTSSRDKDGVFVDTMAIMDNLDLVIAPDSAYIHLAAAMGKRTWTMLNKASEWRWLTDRNDSPWYPTMKLFRQSELGNWDDVLTKICDKLQTLQTSNS